MLMTMYSRYTYIDHTPGLQLLTQVRRATNVTRYVVGKLENYHRQCLGISLLHRGHIEHRYIYVLQLSRINDVKVSYVHIPMNPTYVLLPFIILHLVPLFSNLGSLYHLCALGMRFTRIGSPFMFISG